MRSPIAFEFTSQMHKWIHETAIAGPCCACDAWTYGRIEIELVERKYFLNGEPKTFIAKDWRTVPAAAAGVSDAR